MKVLMITPIVDENHSILGFIPTWVKKLAEKVDKLYVITTKYNIKTLLPENVIVYSIDKELKRIRKVNRLMHFVSKQIYFNYVILKTILKVDVVFTHMYVNSTIIVAPYAKLFRKPIVAWYTHGHVSRRLKIAHFLADKMVTASKESLRIKSDKIVIIGHGIDTDRFKPAGNPRKRREKKIILSVGRISPIKNYETLIKAANILVNEEGRKNLEFIVVGAVPMVSQEEYYKKLKRMIRELKLEDYVKFVGAVPHTEVVKYYQQCDIHVNMCPTGGVDKAVLEAMACGKPVLVCNETFRELLKPYEDLCLFRYRDFKDMAEKLKNIVDSEYLWSKMGIHNREVINSHSVTHLMDSLIGTLKKVAKCK